MNPCDICIEEECKGEKNCNCETCKVKNECTKFLHPTIRITTKCTQSCSHCCFSCSPEKSDFMSIETAWKIRNFLNKHEINVINLMGGEFYCNPDWKEILSALIEGLGFCRLTSNGDWAGEDNYYEFINEFKRYDNLKISISKDKWHTNKNVDKAEELLKLNNINFNITTDEETTDESVVPIGRSKWESFNMFGMFAMYCNKPYNKYAFLIDEVGEIFKCAMGAWRFTDIEDKDFKNRFKQFNQAFYKSHIMSCTQCIRTNERMEWEMKNNA